MDLKQRVNELIDQFETVCDNRCKTLKTNALINITLTDRVDFTYHKDTGIMMFDSNVWYLDEERMYQALKIESVREKTYNLLKLKIITIEQIEAMIFKLV